MLKLRIRKEIISNRELFLAAILTGVYILTGFTTNPIAWPEQVYYRFAINQRIQPDNPQIVQLEAEFKEFFEIESQLDYLVNKTQEEKELRALEIFMEHKISYKTDFNNYLALEHIPSVSDVLERGDDCDGIAIVAASLLERLNYTSYVVFGKWHSWIEVHLTENERIITLFDNALPNLSSWYIKYNREHVYIKGVFYLDFALHNYLLILFLIKTTVILITFFKNHEAFQSVYTALIALLLSPIPALFLLSFLSNT